MSDAFVTQIDAAAHTATITLERPDQGNRLQAAELAALGKAIRAAGERDDVHVVALRARGEAFCLGRAPGAGGPLSARGVRENVAGPIQSVFADIRATPVPVVAVVQGAARGFACAMIAQCDLAIAGEGANFAMPELDAGVPPTLALAVMLEKVATKPLLHMVYTGGEIGAEQALAIGLVGEVCKGPSLDARASEVIQRIAGRDRAALCAVKQYGNVAPRLDFETATELASSAIAVIVSSR
jgi:enoyl-CoA hydratase/carnithine racemase